MNLLRSGALLLLVAYFAPYSLAQERPTLSLAEYRVELDRLSSEIAILKQHPEKAFGVRSRLPEMFRVQHDGTSWEVDNGPLRDALQQVVGAKEDARAAMIDRMQERIRWLKQQTEEFSRPASPQARTRLDEIFTRFEFRGVRGPSLWEMWRDEVLSTLDRWLSKIFRSAPRVEQAGQVFVWLMIAAVASGLGVYLYRVSRTIRPEAQRDVLQFSPSAKHWRKWLAEAREAADHGRFREAIHSAYWSGVSYLEATGAWVPDRARTPREYLRLLPASSTSRAGLNSLTRSLELVWYGDRVAASEDFAQVLGDLKSLGCQ